MKYLNIFIVTALLGSTSTVLAVEAKDISKGLKKACSVLKQGNKGRSTVEADDAGFRTRLEKCCNAMSGIASAVGGGAICIKAAPVVLPATGAAVVADGVASCMQAANQLGSSICGTNSSQTITDIQNLCRGLSTELVTVVRDQICGVAQSAADAIQDCGSCAGITEEDLGSFINTITDPPKNPKRDRTAPVRMKD